MRSDALIFPLPTRRDLEDWGATRLLPLRAIAVAPLVAPP
jgi:hypothetical protein